MNRIALIVLIQIIAKRNEIKRKTTTKTSHFASSSDPTQQQKRQTVLFDLSAYANSVVCCFIALLLLVYSHRVGLKFSLYKFTESDGGNVWRCKTNESLCEHARQLHPKKPKLEQQQKQHHHRVSIDIHYLVNLSTRANGLLCSSLLSIAIVSMSNGLLNYLAHRNELHCFRSVSSRKGIGYRFHFFQNYCHDWMTM